METIQVVLDAKLLQAIDRAARKGKLKRSALIRQALREHLKRRDIKERELQDRKGYEAGPNDAGELSGWEAEAIWPEE